MPEEDVAKKTRSFPKWTYVALTAGFTLNFFVHFFDYRDDLMVFAGSNDRGLNALPNVGSMRSDLISLSIWAFIVGAWVVVTVKELWRAQKN